MIDRFVKRHGVRALRLDGLLARHPEFYYPLDGHLNAQGHDHVAKQLAPLITRLDLPAGRATRGRKYEYKGSVTPTREPITV